MLILHKLFLKYEGGAGGPPPEKITLKKATLIRVKLKCLLDLILVWCFFCFFLIFTEGFLNICQFNEYLLKFQDSNKNKTQNIRGLLDSLFSKRLVYNLENSPTTNTNTIR